MSRILIALSELIEYINDPKAEAKRQKKKYEL